MVGPPRGLTSVAGGLVSPSCAKKLTFLNLEVLPPAADALGPGIGSELFTENWVGYDSNLAIHEHDEITEFHRSGLKLHDIICGSTPPLS